METQNLKCNLLVIPQSCGSSTNVLSAYPPPSPFVPSFALAWLGKVCTLLHSDRPHLARKGRKEKKTKKHNATRAISFIVHTLYFLVRRRHARSGGSTCFSPPPRHSDRPKGTSCETTLIRGVPAAMQLCGFNAGGAPWRSAAAT